MKKTFCIEYEFDDNGYKADLHRTAIDEFLIQKMNIYKVGVVTVTPIRLFSEVQTKEIPAE